MSLLVDVQYVPNRILEVVKARILANRERWLQQQQQQAQLKGPTRPRPQQAKFGATPLIYRRPEPAAVGGLKSELVAFDVDYAEVNGKWSWRISTDKGAELIVELPTLPTRYDRLNEFLDLGYVIFPSAFLSHFPDQMGYYDADLDEPVWVWQLAKDSTYITLHVFCESVNLTSRPNVIAIPAGDGKVLAIIPASCANHIFISSEAGPIEETDTSFDFTKAFLISNKSVREVVLTAAALNLIRPFSEDYSNRTYSIVDPVYAGFFNRPALKAERKDIRGIDSTMIRATELIQMGLGYIEPIPMPLIHGPGIFKILEDPTLELPIGYTPEEMMQYIINTYYASGPLLSKSLVLTDEGDAELGTKATWGSVSVAISGPLPSSTVVDQSGIKTKPTMTRFCWDWGKPQYCKQQLNALGITFTPVPPPEPPPAP